MAGGEPAIPALMTAVKLARQEETVVTSKTRFDNMPNELVENSHQLVQSLMRTWVASTEKRHQTTPITGSPLVQWGCAVLWMEST